MKIVTLISLFCITLCFGSTNEIETEHLAAIDQKQGLLVKMSASWCGPCKQFKESISSKDSFKESLKNNNINFLKVDYSKGVFGTFRSRYVTFFGRGMPTVILLNTQGIQQVVNGDKPSESNFRIIQSRSLHQYGRHQSIIQEITKASLDLKI